MYFKNFLIDYLPPLFQISNFFCNIVDGSMFTIYLFFTRKMAYKNKDYLHDFEISNSF